MKLYARLLKWVEMYEWHNAAMRELLKAALKENKSLRFELQNARFACVHKEEIIRRMEVLLGMEVGSVRTPNQVR